MWLVLVLLLLGGCAGAPSTIEPGGPQAARIAEVWWVSLAGATFVFVLVIGLLAWGCFRPRGAGGEDVGAGGQGGRGFPERGVIVAGGVVLPVVMLVPLSVYWLVGMPSLVGPGVAGADFTVEVVGRQFWWEVRYPDHGFVTANEVRVPVGRPVRLRLEAGDVVHSFWVPRLMGKVDMVPGRTNVGWVQADEAGVYWGECAEYCGLQHAKMAFVVVAEPTDRFADWVAGQQRPAAESGDAAARRGAQVFAREGCIECHAIRQGDGVVGGQVGPDLTHVGGRLTIAAGMLENSRGNLAGWVANPQAIKRGVNMPTSYMDSESLLAVVSYLESLR